MIFLKANLLKIFIPIVLLGVIVNSCDSGEYNYCYEEYFFPNSQLQEQYEHKCRDVENCQDCLPDGRFKGYYPNGILRKECGFFRHSLNGVCKQYNENGIIQSCELYYRGTKVGGQRLYSTTHPNQDSIFSICDSSGITQSTVLYDEKGDGMKMEGMFLYTYIIAKDTISPTHVRCMLDSRYFEPPKVNIDYILLPGERITDKQREIPRSMISEDSLIAPYTYRIRYAVDFIAGERDSISQSIYFDQIKNFQQLSVIWPF
ncbi:hypothetical protein [Pontibacter sp. G13]|uniref:toxin-antitoxin system YwqK family antitoxin n=1 Tax=Pontibacter sp. G13 TaxID=3074898 RepID=UPI00288C2A7B|nr:hypothetical protein [Pontibacter sp. G13]WNJ19620.1 hypothetical protein RJD25_03965 [Pontibacter sp. G13]